MRILRYLLGHKIALFVVIVLLVGQAFADLSLPKLTSDIVDVGIQQSGIEHAACDEVSARTHDIAAMMSDAAGEELLAASYDKTESGAYRLNDFGEQRIDELDEVMALPLIVAHVDGVLPEGLTIDGALAAYQTGSVTKEQIDGAVGALEEKMSVAGDSLVEQQAIAAARSEYEALGYDLTSVQMTYLVTVGVKMLALAGLSMVLSVLVGFVASRTGARIGYDLRKALFSKVVSFSEAEIGAFSAASLITRGTNDVQLVQNVSIMLVRMVLYAPILALGGIVMVMMTNPAMGWVVVVAVVAVFAVVFILFKVAMPKFKIMQTLIDRVNLVAREMLTGISVVRAFDREDVEEARFDEASSRLMRTQLFTNRVMTFMMPAMMLIMNATSVGIVWVGGRYIDAGVIQTGDLIAFITYAMVIIMGFLMIGMISIMLPRADVAAARIDEVLSCEPSVRDPETASQMSPSGDAPAIASDELSGIVSDPTDRRPRGAEVVFDDVSFRYDDESECVLENVSFAVPAGGTLAIVGSTGSGKSTVLKLIERFCDVSAGSVRIDGVDVRDMTQHDLRRQIGYVPQKAFLFSGTVASNVRYVDPSLGDERVRRALEIAQASFVFDSPDGLEAGISQGGANVSGGQRQRLAIARAVAADARLFLFDDSFSALDYRTDAALRRALDEQLADVTRIVVAQRISTVMGADCIVVLEDGRVVGRGTHAELMKSCDAYRDIALSQLSEEELVGGGDAA